jgi:hypothetical protein
MAIHFTPIADEAPADAGTFNAALAALDAAIGTHNYAATAPPTANDDEADGYHAGSWWVDGNGGKVYVCLDPTEGAAIWAATGGGAAPSAVLGLTVLASPAATVTFSNVPGGYETLQLHWLARVGASGEKLYAQLNDDTGGSYEYYNRYLYNAGTIDEDIGATRLVFAQLTGGAYAHPASYASPGTAWIPGYAGTTFYKSLHAHFGDYYSSAHPNYPSGGVGRWYSTSAVTKILLGLVSGNNFDTGSRFLLIATGG